VLVGDIDENVSLALGLATCRLAQLIRGQTVSFRLSVRKHF
jgi:hypothetical protein